MKLTLTVIAFLSMTSLSMAAPFLINGTSVRSVQAPWVVKIEKDKLTWCTGSIISSRWILTAAHCFDETNPRSFSVLGGGSGARRDLVQLPPVKKIIKHPKYLNLKLTTRLDIALVELDGEISFSKSLQAVEILSEKDFNSIRDSSVVSIYGWGYINQRGSLPTNLSQITLPLVTEKELAALKSEPFFTSVPQYLNRYLMLAIKEQYTTCNGDSGAGWIIKFADRPHLAGVHTAGDYCNSIAVGNPVGPHLAWIDEVIR